MFENQNFIEFLYNPLFWNPTQRRILELVGLFGTEIAVFINASGKKILHQSGLYPLLLCD